MTLRPEPTQGDTKWFTHDRFGLFIHWGTYALAARHEWVKKAEQIPDETYQKYFRHFDPDLYDPALWAKAAAGAGMKYFVITTKHHEGFCLFDSRHTDYKATNTAAGRDLLRPMIDAFRTEDMKVGLYHSLIDWHHPEFPIDNTHPMHAHPDREKINAGRDVKKYAEYLHRQVEELLTNYGKIDILWFDFSYPQQKDGKGRDAWNSAELYKLVRRLQPEVILNDRIDLPGTADVKTPEQVQPREWVRVDGQPVVWEACQTFSGSWGYHRDEATWKSVDMLLKMLIDSVSKGGNLLLNVGPTGRGEFDERALDRLAGIGKWMRLHERSIRGCTQAPEGLVAPPDCRYTFNPKKKRLYLHVFSWPFRHIHLDGMADRVEYAQLLNDASEIRMQREKIKPEAGAMEVAAENDTLTLEIPVVPPNVTVPVIELVLKG